ncbi:F1F0 ATP synthase assembly protein Atp10 [Morchella snyderi]|nr:F1F0 ATP synthase assembly protein Atp10 [Morchella snyderi]
MSLPRTLLRHHRRLPLYTHPLPLPLPLLRRHLATAPPPPKKPEPEPEPFAELNDDAGTDPAPPPLTRPIGLDHPPRPDENTGVDTRTWAERRDDFRNWDKHLEKRAKMTKQISKPYFRDLTRLSAAHKGKSFTAPPLLFRADKALFFPNLVGRTLLHATDPLQHTTGALEGKVSVVSVFSSAWAEAQARSFTAGFDHDGVWDADAAEGGCVQRVDINVETNPLRAWLVRVFVPRIRAAVDERVWARYFLVQRGLGEEVRGRMAYVNAKVGYVYLVDWDCRIRWAGSGRAGEEERAALRRGVAKLREDWRRLEAEREKARVERREREEREGERRRAREEMDEI